MVITRLIRRVMRKVLYGAPEGWRTRLAAARCAGLRNAGVPGTATAGGSLPDRSVAWRRIGGTGDGKGYDNGPDGVSAIGQRYGGPNFAHRRSS